ncbi:MAG: 3-deoxy-manno-octulosonate cytidylyltransferase [Candidatus Anammoxibacter sp.]
MNAIAIIPARYASTRLPGKLVLPEAKEITGKYIVEHVYHKACEAKLIKRTIVATDDERIYNKVKQFGGNVEMTPDDLQSGTDRVAWVIKNIESVKELNPDIVVNVQGDEPDVSGKVIDDVVSILSNDDQAVMSTVASPIESLEEFHDPHAVKVVLDNNGNALYFSRSAIPYCKNTSNGGKEVKPFIALKHIGLYAFKKDFLLKFSNLANSTLEEMEDLEQLRVISNGYRIKVAITDHNFIGIDTKEDFKKFLDSNQK